MKLRTRILLLCAAALLGMLVLAAVSLSTLRQTMLKERTAQLSTLVVLAQAAMEKLHAQEKAGDLTREQAQKEAKRIIGSFHRDDLYFFVRGYADDVNLVLSPLHHSAPLRFAMGTRLAGGRVVVPGPFDAARVTAAIAGHRPTSMFCVPAHLQRLLAHWDEVGVPDLSCFRLVAHAGAPCRAASGSATHNCTPCSKAGCGTGECSACAMPSPDVISPSWPGRITWSLPSESRWCTDPASSQLTVCNPRWGCGGTCIPAASATSSGP